MGFYLFTGSLIWLTQVTNNVNTCTQSIFVTGKCRIRDVLQSVSNQHQIQVEYLSENVNWLPIPVSYPSGWTLTCKPRSVLATCTHDMDISFLFLDSQTIRWNRVCMCWISFFFYLYAPFHPLHAEETVVIFSRQLPWTSLFRLWRCEFSPGTYFLVPSSRTLWTDVSSYWNQI